MKRLTQQLAKLSYFNNIKQICVIDSGASAASFKVQTSQGLFFAKYLASTQMHTEISCLNDQKIEVKTNLYAAEQGLAPEVCYFDSQWLISRYFNGIELSKSHLCLNDKLHIAIELMYRCHQLNRKTCAEYLPVLSIQQTIDSLINYDFYQPEQLYLLQKIADYLATSIHVEAKSVCHGDINFTNILLSHQNQPLKPYYLIDYECACLANVEYDIAMLLAVNHPNNAYHKAVIHLYEEFSSYKIDDKLVTRYLCFCYLINALWYFNKFKQTADQTMQKYAVKQFELLDEMDIFSVTLSDKMR